MAYVTLPSSARCERIPAGSRDGKLFLPLFQLICRSLKIHLTLTYRCWLKLAQAESSFGAPWLA